MYSFSATATTGGGVFREGYFSSTASDPDVMLNVTITGNSATVAGGGIRSNGNISHLEFINSILYGNSAASHPEILGDGPPTAFKYSIIEGCGGSTAWQPVFGINGGNNLDVNPQFTNAETKKTNSRKAPRKPVKSTFCRFLFQINLK